MPLSGKPFDIVESGVQEFHGLKDYVDTGNVESDEIVGKLDSISFVSRKSRANMETEENDVLFAKMANTRKTLLIDQSATANIYSTGFFVLRPKPVVLRPKYLHYWVRWEKTELFKDRLAHGETQRQLNNKQLTRKFPIPTPELSIQDQWIAKFDKVDSLLRKLRQQRKLAEQLLVSKREESFSIDNHSNTLESLCTEPPYRYPTFYGFEYVKVGIPVLKISNMTLDGKLPTDTELYDHITPEVNSQFPKTIVKENDLIIEVRGTYIGKTALVPKELSGANISPNTIRISPDASKIIPEYLWHYTFTSWWQNQIDRITRRWKLGFGTVRADRLKLVLVPAPLIEAQKAVLSELGRIDMVVEKFSRSIDDCEELLQTLLESHFGTLEQWSAAEKKFVIPVTP